MGVLLHLLIRLVLLPVHLVHLVLRVAQVIGCAVMLLTTLVVAGLVVAVVLAVHH